MSEAIEQKEAKATDRAADVEYVKFRIFDETTPLHLQDPSATFPATWDARVERLRPGQWYVLPRGFLENFRDATHPVQVKHYDAETIADGLAAGEDREMSSSLTGQRFRIEVENPSPEEIAQAMGVKKRGPGRPPGSKKAA